MITDNRREKLLEFIRRRGFASLPDMAEEMAVSESTIRRDLEQLEATGTAKRTHGGVFYTGPSPQLQYFDDRPAVGWDRKRAIARAVAELIEDGDTVLLDGGSTTYELAQLLVGRPLQVVTNSLPVATLFTSSADTDLVMIGGYIHSRTGVSLGPYARGMLEELNARRAILSVAGITEKGYFNSNLLLVETEQAMMRAADEVIVVADSTKFGKQSLALLCELAEIQTMVVDDEVDAAWQKMIAAAGVQIIVATQQKTSPTGTEP